MSLLAATASAHRVGVCVLPASDDGSKMPALRTWKAFQTTRPTADEVHGFDFARRCGFGMIAGLVSGHRESWDFDCADTFAAFVDAAQRCGLGPVVERIRTAYEDETPGGGRRWVVQYAEGVVWHDCTLARRPGQGGEPPVRTLIEMPTFAILAPSHGGTHPSGKPYVRVSGGFDSIARYSADEREALLELARTFDKLPRRLAMPPPVKTNGRTNGTRPGDDYNARMTWAEVLEPEGWTRVYTRGDVTHWRRPGKTHGISATTNYGGSDLFYPFTSSSEFQPDTSYTKFAVYAVLHHGGDYSKAAQALAKLGYGEQSLVEAAPEPARATAPCPPPPPRTLVEVTDLFIRWLGAEYDIEALFAVLAAAAAERLDGDPLWLLVVSGPGNAKTETVQALAGAGALVTSTVSSEGALLSATARRERTKEATGGLLRRLGARGLLVVKDVTSVLAMNRDTRASLLAALREIHDGRWERNVGTDGGRSLLWEGRLVVIGAVTTAWDRAHDVIASMGDRFVLVRMDSTVGRMSAGRQACRNTGDEVRMRAELAAGVGGLLGTVAPNRAITLTDAEHERLLEAANVVTLARTGVEYDYRGDVIDAHAPEMPTRFAKQLTQLVRGAVAVGLARDAAVRLAIRCARDSMPPLRLAILDDVAAQPHSLTSDVRRRLRKPRATVDRQLQALHMLGVLACTEEGAEHRGTPVTLWRYYLADGINPHVLDPDSVPDLSPHTHKDARRETEGKTAALPVSLPTDISGTDPDVATKSAGPDRSTPLGALGKEAAGVRAF